MRVGIVGGGVIGLCTAYYLKKLGADPVIIESSTLGDGCSLGNAGWVFPSKSTPLAKPGLTLQSLKWMLRRDSPLHIKPANLLALAPWLMRFRSLLQPRRPDAGNRRIRRAQRGHDGALR